jgi:hypothetical protein
MASVSAGTSPEGSAERFELMSLALLAVGAMLLVAGCGESSMGALSVTKEEFIRQADLVCNKGDALQPDELEAFVTKHEKVLERLAPVPYEATVAEDHILPSVKRQIRELEALEPPDSERKKFDAIVAGWNAAVRRGEKDPYSVANFWVPAQDPFTGINRTAARYGFNDCAELR